MTFETVSTIRSHGGTQGVYRHRSDTTGTDMSFAVFVPDHEAGAKLPVLWYLSGLTCTHANVTEKGEYRAACAEHGVIFVAPDTSPRGDRKSTTSELPSPMRISYAVFCMKKKKVKVTST